MQKAEYMDSCSLLSSVILKYLRNLHVLQIRRI